MREHLLRKQTAYAAGVGKTYRMLEEAQQLKRQGKNIVVGYFEPHGRKDTIAKVAELELMPRRLVAYRGCTFQEMDSTAILSRHPAICVVDELAHTNMPGSERSKRWEDVQVLLDAGIDVVTNMNIQHLDGDPTSPGGRWLTSKPPPEFAGVRSLSARASNFSARTTRKTWQGCRRLQGLGAQRRTNHIPRALQDTGLVRARA